MDETVMPQFIEAARRALDEMERYPQSFKSAIMSVRMTAPVKWSNGLTDDTVYMFAGVGQDALDLWRGAGKKLFAHD